MKKKLISLTAAAVLAVSTLLSGCGGEQAETSGDGGSNGTLVMATNATFEPYEFIRDGEVVGIDVDIAQAICDKLGMELQVDNIEFDAIIPAIQSGRADVGIAGITVTEERQQSVAFTDSYATSTQVIIVPEDTTQTKAITTEADLAGARIGVQLGTTGDIKASDYEEEGATVERYTKGADAVQALTQGKIDCVIIDKQPAESFVAVNEGLTIIDQIFEPEDYAICLSKDNTELRDQINEALAELKADGTIDSIIANYIGDDTESQSSAESE